MHYDKDLFLRGCADFSLTPDAAQLEQFEAYAALLLEWNQKVNLTAICTPDGIAVKHFLDSIAPIHFCPPDAGARVADVGSGAGFPLLPILIMRPDLQGTMIDSLNKRVLFLQEVLIKLGLQGSAVHFRAEEAGREEAYREQFDVVYARAVAALPVLAEYSLPLVRPGGLFCAFKGYDCAQELDGAAAAVGLLAGRVDNCYRYDLDQENRRSLVTVKKISQISTKYPRKNKEIARKPL